MYGGVLGGHRLRVAYLRDRRPDKVHHGGAFTASYPTCTNMAQRLRLYGLWTHGVFLSSQADARWHQSAAGDAVLCPA